MDLQVPVKTIFLVKVSLNLSFYCKSSLVKRKNETEIILMTTHLTLSGLLRLLFLLKHVPRCFSFPFLKSLRFLGET